MSWDPWLKLESAKILLSSHSQMNIYTTNASTSLPFELEQRIKLNVAIEGKNCGVSPSGIMLSVSMLGSALISLQEMLPHETVQFESNIEDLPVPQTNVLKVGQSVFRVISSLC